MDVLYRVRPGDNPTLRYSLRSLANVEHGEVFIVGSPPSWVRNVTVLPPSRSRGTWHSAVVNTLGACKELKGRMLLLMDDDFYILRRRAAVEPMYRGTLAEHVTQKRGAYQKSLKVTDAYLSGLGIEAPLSYDLHVPLPIDADALVAALTPASDWPFPVQVRSVYGNVAGIGGSRMDDVKLPRNQPLPADYLSTSPSSWRYYGPLMASLFPEPSIHE